MKEERFASPTVTAIMNPPQVSADRLQMMMRNRFGVEIAGGQGTLEGKTFRIGHLGAVDGLDIIAGIAALEISLQALGYPVKQGSAVGAAEEVIGA